jgi:hypothetical protein
MRAIILAIGISFGGSAAAEVEMRAGGFALTGSDSRATAIASWCAERVGGKSPRAAQP